jgi:hypothetical protein
MIFVFTTGCAPGPGANLHKFFDDNPPLQLPFKIEIDEETRLMRSGAIMGEDSVFQAFMVGGLIAVAVIETPGAVGAIRGNFAVGEVFNQCAKSFAVKNPGEAVDTLNLKLIYFQQYTIPGTSPRLKAFMEFEAHLSASNDTTLAGYACDWEGQGMALTPAEEKNMLNEMVEQSLFHWSNYFSENLSSDSKTVEFPQQKNGEFSGNGVKCTFDIFARP